MLVKIGGKYHEVGSEELTTKVDYNGTEVSLAEYKVLKSRENEISYYYIDITGTAYHSSPECYHIKDKADVVCRPLRKVRQSLRPCTSCINNEKEN